MKMVSKVEKAIIMQGLERVPFGGSSYGGRDPYGGSANTTETFSGT